MKNHGCALAGDREHMLMGYVYGEIGPADQAIFELHVAVCSTCRDEIAELQGIRAGLRGWAPPERGAGVAFADPRVSSRRDVRAWRDVPVWLQTAAALLVVGVAAGAANLNIKYDHDGFTVRTGWLTPAPVQNSTTVQSGSASGIGQSMPWRPELAAFERQLRADFELSRVKQPAARPVSGPSAASADDLRRMRSLIAESERKEERELALRIAEVVRDMQTERQADLVKIERSLGVIQNNTGVEMMRNRQLLNTLAVRVSQKQ
jgi:hypothetical protein